MKIENRYMQYFLFVVAGIVLYGNTLEAPFYFDDFNRIVYNPAVRRIRFQ